MARTWEQEKAWRAKRADVIREQLAQAIADLDAEAFRVASEKAFNYLKQGERTEWMHKYYEARLKEG